MKNSNIKNILSDIGNGNYIEEDRSIEKIIEILKLSPERADELKKFKCKDLLFFEIKEKPIEEVVDLNKLVGWNRHDNGENWYENLDKLHKFRNFQLYKGKKEFEISMNAKIDDLPEVIEYQNEYYVNGNGKHRLTIAKCIGVTEMRVSVLKCEVYNPRNPTVSGVCCFLRTSEILWNFAAN